MGEHRSRIGAALLASVAVFGAAAASIAATDTAGWGNPIVIGLLACAALCFLGSFIAFKPAPTGNAQMNRLIYRQWRALKWRRCLRRLLRQPQEAERIVLPTSRPPASGITADESDIAHPLKQSSPLAAWLERRIEAHDVIVRERAVRSEKEYRERMGAWDTQNLNELSGLDPKTLRADPSRAIALELAEWYRADPRNPGHVDGIEPPHTPEIWAAYYNRRFDWLKETLIKLRDSNEPRHSRSSPAKQNPKEPVSPEHRDMLKGVARKLRSYVNASQHAYYGEKGDERKAQAFQEHFPDMAGRVTEWNEQIAAFEIERHELQEWVEQRLRMLAYQQPPFAWGYAGVIVEHATVEDAELPFHVPQIAPLWLHLGPYSLAPDPPPDSRTREGIEDELRGVLSEARQRPQCAQIRQIRDSLAAASEPLISDLDLIQAKDVINGLGECVLCR